MVLNGFLAIFILIVIAALIVFIAALPSDAVWCPIVFAALFIVFLFEFVLCVFFICLVLNLLVYCVFMWLFYGDLAVLFGNDFWSPEVSP